MLRYLLYSVLTFKQYLRVLSWGYFLSFELGLLKNNPNYRFPYLLRDVVTKNDIIVDIGANLGYFTRLFAKWVGDAGSVYAVEPIKPILEILEKNVRGFKNVVILPYALGAEEKAISIGGRFGPQGRIRSGSHSVLDEHWFKSNEADYQFPAEMKRGSLLFADLRRLDLLKCDIEGFEIVVLPEMIDVIKRHMPMLLVEASRANRSRIVELLYPLGFVGLEFDNDRLVEVGHRKSDTYGDILFVTEKNFGRLPADRRVHLRDIVFPARSIPDLDASHFGNDQSHGRPVQS